MYELQPLRIATGWKVEINNFTEYDCALHGPANSFELHEDLLQLSNEKAGLTIDLGWYPSYDKSGSYLALLIKNHNWDFPLQRVSSQSKVEVISCIEKWTIYDFWQQYTG